MTDGTFAADLAGADDATIRLALEDAALPAMLVTLAHVTGDMSLLREEFNPDAGFLSAEQGGLTEELQAKVRDLAFETIVRFRDSGCQAASAPSQADLRRMLDFLTGSMATDEYVPLLLEELAFPDADARAPHWSKQELDPSRRFEVVVIGAGMSGILAAIRLQQAGVPFVILEKNADVGGTWLENTYPGARVDSSNHFYSYSFAQKADWPYHYSTGDVLLDYFRGCADQFGIREHIRFNTEVVSAEFDESAGSWSLAIRNGNGEETLTAQALISAVGQLNRPKMPAIDGIDSFTGPSFHSAQWDHSVDLTGKRVAVIGNGASASQFIPIVAEQAGQLEIFQRTPNWYVPVPNYHDEVEPGLQWLLREVPQYTGWFRFWLFWQVTDGFLPAAQVDPEWGDTDRFVSAANQEFAEMLIEYMKESLGDNADLLQQVIPSYPPASKRIVLDNGAWPNTLKRDNVHLLTEGIKAVTPSGVITDDGQEHEADVIIYGTGFQASAFLTPMSVKGRNGIDLNEQWQGDARAFKGIMVPNFPNFFMLYGPNTNIVVNGSTTWFAECEVTYVMGCIRLLLEGRHSALDTKLDRHDAYNEHIDAGNLAMAWGVAKVPSWYRNEFGRSAQNWPFSMLEYWQQTREPDPADHVFLEA
jgi:4-hydroxyacetophenone monooxygenase